MLSTLHIRGFKSILDTTLDLGIINVFIGANGSGKSNILEALGVLSAAASSTVDDEALQRRGVRPGLPTLYKSSFMDSRTPTAIHFDTTFDKDVHYNVSLNNPIEKPSKSWQFKTESLTILGKNIFSAGVKTWRNKNVGLATSKLAEAEPDSPEVDAINRLKEYAIYTPNTPTLRGIATDSIRGAVGLQGGGLADAIKALKDDAANDTYIDEALDLMDWIESFRVTTSASLLLSPSVSRQKNILVFKDSFMKDARNELTAYDASEGALYVLFALALARSSNTLPLFAVDNFDQALNPLLAKRLTRLFCRWMLQPSVQPRQALLTVHNPMTLDELPINDDRVRLFAVDRNSDGVTTVNRITVTPELRNAAEQHGWSLSRLWVMGHLGGIPNV